MEQSFSWVLNCIDGSKSIWQFTCCFTLIELFEKMYKEEPNSKERIAELKAALDSQEIKHSLDS